QLLLLLELEVQHPHEVASPAHGAVEDVALVGALVLILERQARRDIAGGAGARRAPGAGPGEARRRLVRVRDAVEAGRERRAAVDGLADLVVLEPVRG